MLLNHVVLQVERLRWQRLRWWRRGWGRGRQGNGLVGLRDLAAEQPLAVRDVLLGTGGILFVGIRRAAGLAQELSEAADGFLVAVVLLVAAALVVQVDGIVAADVEVGQDLHALGRIVVQAGTLRRPFLGVVARGLGRRHHEREREQ